MSKFGGMRAQRERAAEVAAPVAIEAGQGPSASAGRAAARAGKKAVSGYFSPAVSKGLNVLAIENGVTLQSLMGEAFDDLMRKYGKHPFGER
ncbi:ribbon-helix-helix domain-containing protein [Sphingomonas oryzagri]|uniref:Antitoxin-like ribbon-helix-helix domain-containing protein n=1 Tax=Sphingomonas oryzagri TaxID=3042314 RepID=A0ABT6N7S3_9SPHN|nr:ribbon-helix-helix domain-containing protein [Sphingomonas oryzagri]MDH7641154.1 hypothetical protein [Sphingomonas oryzagri]